MTSVGGTDHKKVWNLWGASSGGGIDSSIPTPQWQVKAMDKYNNIVGGDNTGRG